jgi:hypothetical protein
MREYTGPKFVNQTITEFILDEIGYNDSVEILFTLNEYPDYGKMMRADIMIKLSKNHPPLVIKHRRKLTPFFLKD